MFMITLEDCKRVMTIQQAALIVANKVAFDQAKGYCTSWNGQTYWEFASNLNRELAAIEHQLDNYRFDPCLLHHKRVKSKIRKLFMSTWRDKIVEVWLSKALNKLLSNWLSRRAYAYRIDKLGVDQCQKHIIAALRTVRYVAKRDISNFFYTIRHDQLLGQIAQLVSPQLLGMIRQRVAFEYYDERDRNTIKSATAGVPFGSSIACILSNIYLTALDKLLSGGEVHYFRYSDDFFIGGASADCVLRAAYDLECGLLDLGLTLNTKKSQNFSFVNHRAFLLVNRFKHLGLEYWNNGVIRLPVEKRRKIINIFKRAINIVKLQKISSVEDRLAAVVSDVNNAVLKRIRYAAILDYYLKHVDDEVQLRAMDMEVAQLIISAVLGKPFRKRDFKAIPYKKLRAAGLISLVHRHRLHKHGILNVPFLSLYNSILLERNQEAVERRKRRISQIKLARKLRCTNIS